MQSFLIADDSHEKILFLQHMLKRAGFAGEVFVAETTESAIALIDAHPEIGFAFIDYYIPSESGPAIIKHLHQKNPAAHIALVSSADSKRNAEEAKAAGAETAVCTSYQSDEVERSLLTLLEQWFS